MPGLDRVFSTPTVTVDQDKYDNLIKIGITGSYAKTSVKNILSTMLNEKYKVCSSPLSFNKTLFGSMPAFSATPAFIY